MNSADLRFLLGHEGQQWLEKAKQVDAQTHLQWATRLRRHLTPAQTHAVLETVLLRQRAAVKFTRAAQMYFTRAGLEQASGETVAHYRAQRFAAAGVRLMADLGCGIGGDALALASKGIVIGVDRSEVRLRMARENMRINGREGHFWPLQGDLLHLPPLAVDALFFDPARREADGRRLFSVEDYRPPLSLIDRWRAGVPEAAVKISPGVDYAELPPEAEAEFISVQGEVKECVLWYGDLRTAAERRATLLPQGVTLTAAPVPPIQVAEPRGYLYEPDGAIIRAHVVEQLAHQLGAVKIDDKIAYLTADEYQRTPAAAAYELQDWFPFQLKRLRHYLRARRIGRVVVKKRGSPLEPERLQRQLRLKGDKEKEAILFLTKVRGEPAVLIGRAIKKSE